MRILVTGRDGQVARSLAERAALADGLELVFAARPDVDLAEPGSLASAIAAASPDLVINAAAYTAVDKAESDAGLARRINAEAAGEGAEAAAARGIPFVQLSTDYVFDGTGERAWREDDPIDPVNVYGLTKSEGERRVLAASDRHHVVRTSWLVSPFGQNFVKTMLRLAADRPALSVVDDQVGCPTSTLDLADALLTIARRPLPGGVWHIAGTGDATWADLAEHVMTTSAALGGPSATIGRVTTAAYPTPARRPANSRLDCAKFTEASGFAMPEWRASVATIVERLVAGR